MGGGDFARNLFEADLLDEGGFNVHPALLGDGIPHSIRFSPNRPTKLMRTRILLLGFLSSSVLGQVPAPSMMYIYRDSLKRGVDSAYRAI